MPAERPFTLRQIDQARGDLYALQDDLDFIKVQLAQMPMRNEVWRARPVSFFGGGCYRLAATWLNTPLRSVPTVPMTTTAATAISAAISPYSIAVTPRLSLIRQYRDVKLRIVGSPN